MYKSISILILVLSYIPTTQGLYFNYCDIVWSEMHYGDALSFELEKECRNRFIWHTNREKTIMRHNFQKQYDISFLNKFAFK